MAIMSEQFPAIDSNPVLSVGKDGTILYSNQAAEPLLYKWGGVKVGEKLPLNIVDIVQQVISKKTLEKMEFKAENKIYSLAFIPLPEQEIVSIFGFNITDQKELDRKEDNMENCRQDDMESKIRVLESIIGSSHDAIITKSLDGIILSWNKGAEIFMAIQLKKF